MGDINSSSCFDLCGVPFACCDGAGGILLQNITSLNGGPPGGGGTGGNPAPPNGSIQFNTAGSFAGSPRLIWNNTSFQINLLDPPSSNTGNIYVDATDFHIAAGPATQLQLYSPTSILEESSQLILVGSAPTGPAISFATATNSQALQISDGSFVANTGSFEVWNSNHSSPFFVMDTSDGSTYLAGPMGIGVSPTFPYYLDVNGNVNASGCYYIFGASFACTDGAGGVALSNITTINGQPPGGGGGGGTPAPPNMAVQFDNNGAFGGDARFIWNSSLGRLGIGDSGIAPAYLVDINSVSSNGMRIGTTNATGSAGLYLSSATARSVIEFYSAGAGFPDSLLIINDSSDGSIFFAVNGGGSIPLYMNSSGFTGIGGNMSPAYPLDVNGDMNISSGSVYRIGGVPWDPQTPWLSNIDAAGFQLLNAGQIGIFTNSVGTDTIRVQTQTSNPLPAAINLNSALTSNQYSSMRLAADSGNYVTLMVSGTANATIDKCQFLIGTTDLHFNAAGTPLTIQRSGIPASYVGVRQTSPAYPLDVGGDVNIAAGSVYRIGGVPLATGSQTPWTQNINGANFSLGSVSAIGIGTPATATPIWISQNSSNNTIYASNANSAGSAVIELSNNGGAALYVGSAGSASTTYPASTSFLSFQNPLLFMSGGVEYMRITQAGLVGIGTAGPQHPLHVMTTGATSTAIAVENDTIGVNGAAIEFRATDSSTTAVYGTSRIYGVFDSPSFPQCRFTIQTATGNETFQDVLSLKNTSVGIRTNSPAYELHISGGYTSGTQSILAIDPLSGNGLEAQGGFTCGSWLGVACIQTFGAFPFSMNPAGGAVGIGTTTPGHQLELSTDSAAKPSTNTWTVTSDIRTKRNVQRFYGDLDVIRSLDPIVAEYNGLANTPEGARVVGFSAQDLQQILPQCVSEDAAGVLGVNTHEIFFHMLRAIQYLDQQVTYLTQRLEAA